GGLVASTALSLFVVPVIYTLMDDFEYKVKGWFSRGSRHVVPARPDAAQG
ncbi:MAG: hypothetical protein RLZZ393_2003, partial [Pseudomonadota bacterium]